MKKVVIIFDEKSFDNRLISHCTRLLADIWKELGCEVLEYKIDEKSSTTGFYGWIEECNPDYLCSLDMSGFSINTLTGNRYYNICFAKQIHIITYKKIWEYYANEAFALNLYMFLPGETEHLRKKYPDVPNIYGYETFKCEEKDKEILEKIVSTALEDILGTTDFSSLKEDAEK